MCIIMFEINFQVFYYTKIHEYTFLMGLTPLKEGYLSQDKRVYWYCYTPLNKKRTEEPVYVKSTRRLL